MSREYSHAMACTLSRLSQLAYEDEGEIRRRLLEEGRFRPAAFFASGEARGFLAEGRAYSALVFRGTENRREIIEDVRSAHVEIGGRARVNAGFYRNFLRVEELTLGLADRATQPLYLAGHSLGGALAVLASRRLAENARSAPAACYTFGCPRVGNPGFIRSLNVPVHPLVHGFDLVPHMPPRILTPYSDAGRLRRIGRSLGPVSGLVGLAGTLAYVLLKAGAAGGFQGLLERMLEPTRMVQDHHVSRYVEALERSGVAAQPDLRDVGLDGVGDPGIAHENGLEVPFV